MSPAQDPKDYLEVRTLTPAVGSSCRRDDAPAAIAFLRERYPQATIIVSEYESYQVTVTAWRPREIERYEP